MCCNKPNHITRRKFLGGLGASLFAHTTHALVANPEPIPSSAPNKVYLPAVLRGSLPAKAGLAPSSYDRLLERIDLLGGVAAVRGWRLGDSIPAMIGNTPYLPCWWCDTYTRAVPNEPIQADSQMHVPHLLAGSDGELLLLNEPDLTQHGHYGQCEASPRKAAVLYAYAKQILPNVRFVGPGISHLEYTHGFPWLRAWINEVVGMTGAMPQMWAWDIHHYIMDGDPLAPVNALEQVLGEFGIANPRIFISEWGACSAERVSEMRTAFDNDPRVRKHLYYDQTYALWDGADRCTMLFEQEGDLRLSPLGQAWVRAGRGLA